MSLSLETRYIVYRVLNSLIFFNVVWLYFYRLYITDAQVGILDSIAFFIGFLFEIPSGAIADAIGRKKVVRIGQISQAIWLLLQVWFPSMSFFIMWQSLIVIGMSLSSGTDDALFYSALRYDPENSQWKTLITRASKWVLWWSLIATISGAYLHTIHPIYPWCLTAISIFLSTVALMDVPDTVVKKDKDFSTQISTVYRNIISGIGNFGKPKILLYVPIILGIQSLLYTFWMQILRPILLDRFHFSPFLGWVVIWATIIVSIWSLHYIEKRIEQIHEWKFFAWIGIMCALSLLISVWDIGYWWWIVLLILSVSERILYPFISDGLNKNARESERATILSIWSFLKWIPYVILGPIIGYLNTVWHLEYFLIGWSIIIWVALLIYTSWKNTLS